MNSVKSLLIIVFTFTLLGTTLYGEGVPFSVSSTNLPAQKEAPNAKENTDTQTNLISDLKYQAVVEWLQGYLGSRYANYDKFVTPEFAEKYILDYKVSRSGQPGGGLELNGHLDGDSLKKWIRLAESKYRGSTQLRPLFIISSNIPGMTISPADTANRLKDSRTADLIAGLVNLQFQKLNTRLTPLESSVGFENPPKNDSEMKALRNAASRSASASGVPEGSMNTAVWVALTTCSACGGSRIDIFFYSLPTLRLVSVVGEDLNLNAREFSNTELVKRAVAPAFSQFHTELETSVSEGKLFDASYHVLVENIDSYRLLKALENEMARVDFLSTPVLKRAEGKAAEYEVLTSYSLEEFTRRLQTLEIGNLKPKITRTDGTTVVMRYK